MKFKQEGKLLSKDNLHTDTAYVNKLTIMLSLQCKGILTSVD